MKLLPGCRSDVYPCTLFDMLSTTLNERLGVATA